jgi:CDP-diacylglycerol---serine O-phosphatidyltransferase
LRSSTTFLKVIVGALFVGCLLVLREKILYYVLPLFLTGYLLYGFVRPHISRAWRKEIEEDEDEPEAGS